MHIKLSSSRAELVRQLFLEIDIQRKRTIVCPQIVVVPDGGLLAWVLMAAATARIPLLDVELTVAGEPYIESSFCHYFGFRAITQEQPASQIWYIFSPCGHFWSDLLSERELGRTVARTKLAARNSVQEALESFYSETNSLLSNAAILGRKSAQVIEGFSAEVESFYPVTEALLREKVYQERLYDTTLFLPKKEDVTLLRRVQADLIFLVGARNEKESIFEDCSLRIIEAPTLRAEVSHMAEVIHEISCRAPIGLGDVLILTPTPSLYEPVVRHLLPTLTVQSLYDENPLIVQRLRGWFDLIQSRFDKKDLVALASLPEMGSILECDDEEMAELRGALTSSRVTWGVTGEFRKKWLFDACIQAKEASLEEDTIQELFVQKIHNLFETEEIKESLDADWKSLLRFLSLVERLATLWEAPMSGVRVEKLPFWVQKVEKTIQELIASFSSDDLQILSSVIFSLADLEKREEAINGTKFFDLFLKQVRLQVKNTPQALVGHVLIGSVLETIPTPARYVVFLGMGEDEIRFFISKEAERSTLERRELQDLLNYAVIDGMMQAKERVHLSYIGWDFELRQNKEPGAIVTLIENYVEGQFTLGKIRFQKNILFSKKKRECANIVLLDHNIQMPTTMNVGTFVSLLADPLSYYMKQVYGYRHVWKSSDALSLFAPVKQLERLVEREMTSREVLYKRGQSRGVSHGLLQKELYEMKKVCGHNLEAHFGKKFPGPVQYSSEELLSSSMFSRFQLEGNVTIYPPFLSIVVAADLEQAIIEGLWAKLTFLSLIKNESRSVFCAIQGVAKELLEIDPEYIESFFEAIIKQPFPFQADLLPTIIGSKASFTAFEDMLQEKVQENDPLCMSFALLGTKEGREQSYPLWKMHAERLIAPWIEWGKIV